VVQLISKRSPNSRLPTVNARHVNRHSGEGLTAADCVDCHDDVLAYKKTDAHCSRFLAISDAAYTETARINVGKPKSACDEHDLTKAKVASASVAHQFASQLAEVLTS
jgi:hypothetical protein